MNQLNQSFQGPIYRLVDNWVDIVPIKDEQINYLEIGAFVGANIYSAVQTYGKNPDSKFYCIDPWEDYNEYPEYKNSQESNYQKFQHNISLLGVKKDQIIPIRGYSNNEIPKFQDDFFDIIYVDGNHEPEFVCEDAVLGFRKLKKGGYMIFDDWGWGGKDLTQAGIEGFCRAYHKRIKILALKNNQVFIQKL